MNQHAVVGKFSHNKPGDTEFTGGGLRDFFLYRDLGIAAATGGQVICHLVKANAHMPPEDGTVRSLEIGANDFIAKPFRMKELLARVDMHLRRWRELQQMKASLSAVSEDLKQSTSIVDILHEVTDSLKPDEIYHILSRRVARALGISKCSIS